MQLEFAQKLAGADGVILPFWQGVKKGEAAVRYSDFKKEITAALQDFRGKEGETTLVYTSDKKIPRLLLLGCGIKSKTTDETLRIAAASAVKFAREKNWSTLALIGHDFAPLIEGILLTNYRFDAFKKEKSTQLKKLILVGASKQQVEECKRRHVIIEAVNFARDLINGNADDVTPQMLSKTAVDLCKTSPKLKATILGKKEIEKEKFGLLLAVNRASSRDPALIIVEYRGNPKSKTTTALVGKGITYDTGGLHVKPRGGMETMKDDMSGAAAVLGTIKALSELKVPVNVIGVIPSTENMIGSKSYKPGDVYTSYSGKTVEIDNTDAEGRLVLADAISYVQDHFKPTEIIDIATLTGAIVVTLGDQVSGLFSNNNQLSKKLTAAGEKTYERLWRLPLYPEYRDALNSKIADMRNSTPERKASSITAALFIQDFVGNIPWAHLDIAGTAYLHAPRGYHSTPATGMGVRLLVEYFSHEI